MYVPRLGDSGSMDAVDSQRNSVTSQYDRASGGPEKPTGLTSPTNSAASSAPSPSGKGSKFSDPVELKVRRIGKLGLTIQVRGRARTTSPAVSPICSRFLISCCSFALWQDHTEPRSPSNCLVIKVDPEGNCCQAGLLVGSFVISVGGRMVKNHAHAIALMEAEKESDDLSCLFEMVVREPRKSETVVQSL